MSLFYIVLLFLVFIISLGLAVLFDIFKRKDDPYSPYYKQLRCYQCKHPILENDDAHLCTKCGGYNIRKYI